MVPQHPQLAGARTAGGRHPRLASGPGRLAEHAPATGLGRRRVPARALARLEEGFSADHLLRFEAGDLLLAQPEQARQHLMVVLAE